MAFDSTRTTPLCAIMGRNGSDKGAADGRGWHNYTTFYSALFSPVRENSLRVFELGLGTNNIHIASNMGKDGVPGASLRGWAEYFPAAHVFGADIDRGILFETDRIQTFWCDQTSPDAIRVLWSNPALTDPFDILIEDGLHTFEANKCFFENSIHKVKSGGVYIIEDVVVSQIPRYEAQILTWKSMYPGLEFKVVNIPHAGNRHDNCIIVATKQ